MTRKFFLLFISICFASIVTAQQSVLYDFEQLKKLEGKWLMESKIIVGETWSFYSDELLIGKGWVLNQKGDTVFTEDLRIVRFDKSIVYIAKPMGKNATAFTLSMVTLDNEWIFENKEHNSPQRIVYQLHGFDTLDAWIGDFSKKGDFKEKGRFHYTHIE